jgi:ferric-chelate reductase
LLGVRVKGDWTRALNGYATENGVIENGNDFNEKEKAKKHISTDSSRTSSSSFDDDAAKLHLQQPRLVAPAFVMIDGPYGGPTEDLGQYESVLLFAGGSGVTFTLGILDDIVGRAINGGTSVKTRRVEMSWCVRSFGMLFEFPLFAHCNSFVQFFLS